MVKRNKQNKRAGRRPNQRAANYNPLSQIRGLVTIPRRDTGGARATRVTLVYMEAAHTTSLSGYATILGNGLFDPLSTSAGLTGLSNAQPNSYDVWSTLYTKYTVLGSSIVVRIANGNASTIPYTVTVSPEDALVTSSSAWQSSTAPYARSLIVANGNSMNSVQIRNSMTTAQINGVSLEEVIDSSNYQGLTSGSPPDPWYWQIRFTAADSTTTPDSWWFITVHYDVLFSDPVQDDSND